MNKQDFDLAKQKFDLRIKDKSKERKKLYKLRSSFTEKFSINKISSMSVDEYVIGKGKDTYCYWLEQKLGGLGLIFGATSKKFGIYYGRTKKDENVRYRWSKNWGNDINYDFEKLRIALIELIVAGEKGDTKTLISNGISPMFKGKILSIYFPDKYLNIFANDHLNYYLKFFNLDTKVLIKSDPIIKRQVLVDFKNSDDIMQEWSIDLFAYFLYDVYPQSPTKNKPNPDTLIAEYYFDDFSIAPNAEEVLMEILPFIPKQIDSLQRGPDSKADYEKQNRINNIMGDRGEKLVKDFEKDRLIKLNKPDLASKVDRVSLKSDALGYDILSYNSDGSERYIEVKASQSTIGNANFFMSINEINTANEKKENYYIYYVFDIKSENPKIWIIPNPFYPENNDIAVIPVNFKVNIKSRVLSS